MTKVYDASSKIDEVSKPGSPSTGPHSTDRRTVNWADRASTRHSNGAMQELRASIEATVDGVDGCRIVAFSSARPSEGKTTVIGEFAMMLAKTQRKAVLVVDAGTNADFVQRYGHGIALRPQDLASAGQIAGLKYGVAGEIVTVRVDLARHAEHGSTTGVDVLEDVLQAASSFAYILIDLPSVLEQPGSIDVGRIAHGVVLVVEAERTRWPVVRRTKEDYLRADTRILGVFLNKRKFYIPTKIYERL